MKNLSIIYAIVSLVLMFLFIFLFFRKAENHFKLLKILFPKELEKIESYFDLGFGFQSVKLGIEISFWFYFPIFFVTKRVRLDERENVISLCKILIKNNIKILLSFIVFISWVYGGGWIFFWIENIRGWLNISNSQLDELGSNLERLGGIPYNYHPSKAFYIFNNPGY